MRKAGWPTSPSIHVQIICQIDTHVPTPLLLAHIAASSTLGSGTFRNGVYAAAAAPPPPPPPPPSGSRSVTMHGWMSVVAPTLTASQAAAVAATMLSAWSLF
ncbi:hypothetical protein GYMLUDRAFT_246475 [Collybiopsis luxurians FD-317 M1]|uniref:Uncharacterized protein n=1 Tax=Collybiopsis luxurians FD-317 M1 TaxID=944289 RepID=A0A0D0CIH9_9AGAR|nr:hypothetical protein GYMLUDRAFT_246475 [Collybiopsis luxurians FD-317 M1]